MNIGALKIVLDTNVVISMIGRTSPNRWIFDKILNGDIILCVSNEILLEYEEVLNAKTSKEVTVNFMDFLVTFPYVEHIRIYYNWHLIVQDPDDNKFIDCAVSAQSFCIVSEDAHFRPYKNNAHPPLRIMTVEEFKVFFQ